MYSFIFIFTLFSQFVFSANEVGERFIQNWNPNEYKGGNQIWSIIQDKRGVMYFGTDTNIVEFDGKNWQSTAASNNSYIRSLAIDAEGTIYVGAVGELGILGCNKQGKLKYHSLNPKLPKKYQNFKNVWLILTTSHGVYFFVEFNKIFRWHAGKFDLILEDHSRFFQGNLIGDKVFVVSTLRDRTSGEVLVIDDGKIRTLPNSHMGLTGNDRIYNILTYPGNKLLICTYSFKFYLYDLNRISLDRLFSETDYGHQVPKSVLKEFPTIIDEYLLHNLSYDGLRINHNQHAFSTLKGGIVIVDFEAGEFFIINRERGLLDDCVWKLYLDKSKNLWAGLNNGLSYIEISNPVTKYTAHSGIESTVDSIKRHQGTLYVGMMQKGAYFLPKYQLKLDKDRHHFKPVANYQGQYCWDFFSLGDHLLAASESVNDIVNKKATLIKKSAMAYSFGRSKLFPEYVFMGLTAAAKGGVGYIDTKNMTYQGKLPGLSEMIMKITCDNQGNLWLTTSYNGLIFIEFRNKSINDFEINHYTMADGLPGKSENNLFLLNNQIIVGTPKGIYKGIKRRDQKSGQTGYRFVPENTFGKMFNDKSIGVYNIREYGKDCYFIISNEAHGFLTKKTDGSFFWDTRPFKCVEGAKKNIYVDSDKTLWISATKGLYRYSPKVKKNYKMPYNTLIRRVKAGTDIELFNGTFYNEKSKYSGLYTSFSHIQPETKKPTLEYRQNSLVFEYSACFYEQRQNTHFKYILSGFDTSWSNWSEDTKTKYTNIPEGDYCFRVKAKNIFDHQSSVAEFRFTITPPWYRTIYAYIGYLLMFVSLVMGGIRLNTRRLLATKKKLEKTVKKRTNEVVKQKDEITKQKIEIETAYSNLYTTNRDLTEARNALWGEMELAKKIQTVLLPNEPQIPGYQITGYMKPADEVGGDYYDVINADGKDWIVIGDVSGHGVPAGLVMMMVQTAIHAVLENHACEPPDKILETVNKVIYENIVKLGENKYMTITVLSCIDKGKFYYSGLHQDIMIYRIDEKDVELVETDGMWVGLMDEIGDMLKLNQLSLNLGDVMLLYTDGIIEAKDADKEMYSDEKLAQKFKELGHLSPEEIKNGILQSMDGYHCNDDVTMLILKRES